VSHCQSCGACCANYRVSFPCREVDDQAGGWVPIALVEESTPHVVCMRGTAAAPARCIAEACNDARRRHGMAPLAMNPA